jgi:hypothetical protein
MKDHHGEVKLSGNDGGGTVAEILLPIVRNDKPL